MRLISRGQATDRAHPFLDLVTALHGVIVNPTSLAFAIFDLSDDERRAQPVQVYPTEPGARAAVDVSASSEDRLSPGRFIGRWTPGDNEPLGLHEIRWFIEVTPGIEQMLVEELDVVVSSTRSTAEVYALVSDLREEGVTVKDATDVRLARLLRLATDYVERVTGRFFVPRPMTLILDGSGGRVQLLGHPIVAIGSVRIVASELVEAPEVVVSPSSYRIYNRHVTQGLLDPDDRENPRLEFVRDAWHLAARLGLHSLAWLRGVQNVTIDGVFGFVEPDRSVPALIRYATKLLVLREIPLMSDFGWRAELQRGWRLTSERTRDQSYTLSSLRTEGPYTGDPDIDQILVTYTRPPQLGAA